MDGWIYGWMDLWISGSREGYGYVGGWMAGWTDGMGAWI